MRKAKIVPDDNHHGMFRVIWGDGQRSDMVNIVRARDAIRRYEEYTARHDLEGPAKRGKKPVRALKPLDGYPST